MIVLWVQAISSFAMLIVILIVQVLIYPQFNYVSPHELGKYVKFHIRHISWIVIPIMLVESFSLMQLWTNQEIWSFWLISATVLLVLIWVLTFIKIVPLHNEIARSSDVTFIPSLLSLNLIRTILWVLKSISIFCLFAVFITPSLNFSYIIHSDTDTIFKDRDTSHLIYEKNIVQTHLDSILSSLDAQLIEHQGNLKKYMIKTPYLKLPDVIFIEDKGDKIIFFSKSLLRYFDFGRNKARLKWIQEKIETLN